MSETKYSKPFVTLVFHKIMEKLEENIKKDLRKDVEEVIVDAIKIMGVVEEDMHRVFKKITLQQRKKIRIWCKIPEDNFGNKPETEYRGFRIYKNGCTRSYKIVKSKGGKIKYFCCKPSVDAAKEYIDRILIEV